jgi:hypothetical protein
MKNIETQQKLELYLIEIKLATNYILGFFFAKK